MTDASPPPLPSAAPRWKRRALAVAWVLLSLRFVMPPTSVLEPTLDSSVHATYAYFVAHGFQYGTEVNTTAGPYGFVMFGSDYSGELFWPRYVLIVLFSGALATLVLWFFVAARRGWARWCWLGATSVLSMGDNAYNVAILLCGMYLLLNYQRRDRRLPVVLVTTFLALLSLMKGTQLAVAFAVILSIAALAVGRRTWREALWVIGSYLAALVAWWAAAGQNPLHLPAFVNGLRHIATGYNEAMAVYETPGVFRVGVSLLLALAILVVSTAWRRRTNPVMLAGCVLLAGFMAVAWKHGYVRADGHVFIFLDLGCVLALTVLVLERITAPGPPRVPTQILTGALTALAVGLGLAGGETVAPGRARYLVESLAPQFMDNVRFVADPADVKSECDFELAGRQHLYRLPAVRRAVGRHSIDFFGHEMGRLLLNDLNYAPAPMCCGTYHVYNRYFKKLNVRHFTDPRTRPDFVLLKIQSIDYRFAPIDDSLSLLALLDTYRPRLIEDDMVLLQADPGRDTTQEPRPILTRKLKFEESIDVPAVGPDELLLFSINLPSSWTGKLRELAYKPPYVFMDLKGSGLTEPRERRLIPGSIAVPSLLSPALEKTDDFVALLAGRPGKKIRRLRLHTTDPDCFRESDMSVTFYTVRRPAPLPAGDLRRFYAVTVYADPPTSIDPPNAPVARYKAMQVQYLQAPASVTYRLRGDERRVSVVAGIDENAYTHGGRTDGVDFFIELHEPGQPPRVLARRDLQPLYAPADRGTHLLVGILPPVFAPGSDLVIRTDPGPRHDAAWDWSFVTSVRIARGAFVPEQFPRFATLPVSCDGYSVSPLTVGSRDVTLVVAPGGFTLPLRDTQHELTFTGGLLEASYTTGNTDGAAFFVDYEFPDGRTRRLFSHLLRPKTILADRGDQTFVIPLPPRPPGTRLHVRSDPGPAGNAAFDWVYVSELHLR